MLLERTMKREKYLELTSLLEDKLQKLAGQREQLVTELNSLEARYQRLHEWKGFLSEWESLKTQVSQPLSEWPTELPRLVKQRLGSVFSKLTVKGQYDRASREWKLELETFYQ